MDAVGAPLPPGAENVAIPTLRPLRIGHLMDAAFAIYRRSFKAFITAALVVVVPIFILRIGGILLEYMGYADVPLWLTWIVVTPLALLFHGAVVRMASDAALGMEANAGDAFRHTSSRFWHLLGTTFLTMLACGFAALGLVLPAIVLFVNYVFIAQAVLLEQRGGVEAMRRSAFLVQSFWSRAFFVVLLCGGAFQFLISLPGIGLLIAEKFVDMRALKIVEATLTQTLMLFLSPLPGIFVTVLYYDCRAVKEGLDIELWCEALWR